MSGTTIEETNLDSPGECANASSRFTINGSEALEARLAEMCQTVSEGIQKIIPPAHLEGLVLGGGYGRGQGGVLQAEKGDEPYNDLEFYVFVRGPLFIAERRFRASLQALGEKLSSMMGLHVEFKLDSIEKLRRGQITMYSYDLVAGHKIILGDESLFKGCGHHLAAEQIPASEATRLLFNRCSGLLLVSDLFRGKNLDDEQLDFIGRNLAKAQLGFGDAVLTLFGGYHWDCRERHECLNKLKPIQAPSWLDEVRHHHAEGLIFKLRPRRSTGSRIALELGFAELRELGHRAWLWLESRRLNHPFESVRDYALDDVRKFPESKPFRNCLLNLKAFGFDALTETFFRYPRERLFNALCLLLWDDEAIYEPAILRLLQKELHAPFAHWEALISAYQHVWQNYG